jgi:hypothetical protein
MSYKHAKADHSRPTAPKTEQICRAAEGFPITEIEGRPMNHYVLIGFQLSPG